jgi:hypothetical protein
MRELVPCVIDLACKAKARDLNFTIDAEEADRLELSLDVVRAVAGDPSLRGWGGFGLAVQAYQKRAGAVIDWTIDLAASLSRRFMVRLVKGAYWDAEIKRAQERGLADYPVFTRKAMTDLSYMDCARRLLAARERVFPQFGTHNALTVASVVEAAGSHEGYEFQRLHGMGERSTTRCALNIRRCRAASMRRSAAIATFWPIWCVVCWKTAPTPRSCRWRRIRRCRSPPFSRARAPSSAIRGRRGIRKSRCRATSMRRCAKIRRAWNSATGPASMCWCAISARRRRQPKLPA